MCRIGRYNMRFGCHSILRAMPRDFARYTIARVLFAIFLIIFLVFLILAVMAGNAVV